MAERGSAWRERGCDVIQIRQRTMRKPPRQPRYSPEWRSPDVHDGRGHPDAKGKLPRKGNIAVYA